MVTKAFDAQHLHISVEAVGWTTLAWEDMMDGWRWGKTGLRGTPGFCLCLSMKKDRGSSKRSSDDTISGASELFSVIGFFCLIDRNRIFIVANDVHLSVIFVQLSCAT